jgi:co-chaperonin GroES (HSP10)
MKIEPEGVKVLVLPEKVEEVTEGGIILPEQTKDAERFRKNRGVVLAIGPAAAIEFDDGKLKTGDKVLYAKHSGVFIEDGSGNEVRLVNDVDILARISK